MNVAKLTSAIKSRIFLFGLIIFFVSFGIRLVYLNQLQSMPTFEQPVMDEKYHLELADQINSPAGYPDEPYFRAPLYPYYLAFVSNAVGGSIYWMRFIQIIIGSMLPVLLLFLGLKIFNKLKIIAYISSGIAIIYPTFLYFDASLLITSLMVLLTTMLVLQLYRCQEKPTTASFIIAGILLGVTALARPNVLLFGPLLFIWVWFILKPKIGL